MNARIHASAAAIALAAVIALAGCAPAPAPQPVTPAPTPPATSTPSATTSPTPPATTSVEATPVPAQPSENGKHLAFIRDVRKQGSDYVFVLDFADLFTGDAAYAQGAKDGVSVDNDYYIRNNSTKTRTLRTNGNVAYITYGDSPTDKFVYKVADFYGWRTGTKKPSDFPEFSKKWTLYTQAQATGEDAAPFFFTVKNGLITRIEFFWTP